MVSLEDAVIARLEAGEVVILGTDRSNEGSRLEDQCRDELIAEHMQPWAGFFALLDDMADTVMAKLMESSESTSPPEVYEDILGRILSLRRQILVVHIYPIVNEGQAQLLQKVRAVCLTTTQASKVAAGLTTFTSCLQAESFLVSFS